MNEDLRELMHTETRMDTSVPKEGEITVDQNVKLDRLMRDKYTSDADKERISTLKKSGWKLENIVITELMAQALISDVEHGRKNNMKATKKSKELITKEILSDDNNLTDDIRKKSIVWLNDENRTNGELTALKVKLSLKED